MNQQGSSNNSSQSSFERMMPPRKMRAALAGFLLLSAISTCPTEAGDLFNYRDTDGIDFGPTDWDEVSCNKVDECPGWPNDFEGAIGWKPTSNLCESCPEEGNNCGQHRQSPITLRRDRANLESPNWKDCPDWHWMAYIDGSCVWDDMLGHFSIERDGLKLRMPLKENGDIDCVQPDGTQKFPKLDYSKGFPDWWLLTGTDIHVPSEHMQEGKQYAAEVQMSFVYEIDHYKNKAGKISVFMDAYEGVAPWPYLDKLICQWRKVEEETRKHCGLDPAPVYKRCELYRGQDRTEEDLYEEPINPGYPTRAPLVGPDPIPLLDFGGTPPDFRKPLSLCQGDCDFDSDCQDGLMCFRRYAFEPVPGCIGGEQDDQYTDYCVFDPYGMGYSDPATVQTTPPTNTPRPTNTPLPSIPVQGFGGTPPADAFPLQLCQGDCDSDADCAYGLYCFQRDSNQTVPGCIGAEFDPEKTDYCTFDPYGPGYTPPAPSPSDPSVLVPLTSPPTSPPVLLTTMTPVASPTMAPLGGRLSTPTSAPSYYPRPVGDSQKTAIIKDWNPDYKLGECEGDCDTDEDCMGGMYCYHRNSQYEPISGCLGGELDRTLTDYCTFLPLPTDGESSPIGAPTPASVILPTTAPVIPQTSAPVKLQTSAPVQPPNSAPVSPERLDNLGWTPSQKLRNCQGDCDTDEDCVSGLGLVCFQRNSVTQAVPGCIGGETDGSLTDYCVFASSITGGLPAIVPGQSPTAAPFEPTDSVAIVNYGWSPPIAKRPLHRCEGDCDLDFDCQPGLICFERYLPYQAIPGCTGGESDQSLTDYCIPAGLQPASNPGLPGSPIASPIAPSVASPIASPTAVPPTSQVSGVPPAITCSAYEDVSYDRMCKMEDDSCCANPRSPTSFCHEQYLILGDAVASACYHCCKEATGSAIIVGPAPIVNPKIPKTVECSTLENSKRMCKDDSCCTEEGSGSSWCKEQDELYPGGLQSICWYCCFPSIEVDFIQNRRELLGVGSGSIKASTSSRQLSDGDRETYIEGRKVIIREENFEPKGQDDEDAYFEEIHNAYQRRAQASTFAENYDDVFYWPFEWLLKVQTEYYFRYEGTQTVPPCYDTVHWRILKDPIQIPPHQLKELERLVAWRRGDNCESDVAGKPRPGNPDAIDINRPVQSLHTLHRMVFCECQDWPSKFPQDRQWCRNYQNRPPEQRLFENPYNWPQAGF